MSFFIYEIDTMFYINKLKIALSVLVRILNTGKIFLFALYFITLESAAIFEFIEDELYEIFFYNYEQLPVIYGDFAKGLTSTIVT